MTTQNTQKYQVKHQEIFNAIFNVCILQFQQVHMQFLHLTPICVSSSLRSPFNIAYTGH